MKHGHYINFDVMAEKENWDRHTREIVENRLNHPKYQTLSRNEITVLYHLCSVLTGDEREPILEFIVSHFDNKLTSNLGEGQRQKGLPPFKQLFQVGIKALDNHSLSTKGSGFTKLSKQIQFELIQQLIVKDPKIDADGIRIKAKDFLATIYKEIVSAYYSHPDVWTDIGYAGPAYPRGYIRTERGLRDPWEAKQHHE